MRITIVGGGEIGFALSQALSIDHEVFVVDNAPAVAERFEALDVQFVRGRATSPGVLERAGVAQADVLVACTGLDEVNIVACAIASKLGQPRAFCFVSREEFLGLHDDKGLAEFGIDRVVWPEAQLAADIERIIRVPWALDADTFVDGAIQMVEYRLDGVSALTGCRIRELHLPHGSLIVAVRRGDSVFIPRGENTLALGDRIVVLGTPDALREVTQRVTVVAGARRQRVTIIGGGAVGLRLAERLEADDAADVTLVEADPRRGEMIAGRLRRTLVLNGDGTDLELLESEDIGRSDVLVSVINNDERNLFASLLGRQLGVRRIITRVSKRANLRLFEHVGIDVAISARGAAVASVLHQIHGGTTRLLAVVEQGAGRILELDIPEGYVSRPLRDLAPPLNSIVGAIVRGSHAVIPRGADRIQPGDRLIVFTTHEAVDQVRDYFANVKSQG
jgi:trk system potassium uptake protein TrkA